VSQGVGVVGLYVRDQEEALQFYVNKLGFKVHTDVKNGVDDCRAAYDRMKAKDVEFTQEPIDRFGTVDAGFRDPSGNGWKMIESRRRDK
jgi:catechol 2,3-dioxygenase-like lactoylglutathione lyase family enzyme